MKNLIIIAMIFWSFFSIGQIPEDFKSNFEKRNPYQEISSNLINKDEISSDSIMLYGKTFQTHWSLYDKTIFIVISATDDTHQFVFKSERDNPRKFTKIKFFKDQTAYRVEKFELLSDGPDQEKFLISIMTYAGLYFNFVYDLSTDKLMEDIQ